MLRMKATVTAAVLSAGLILGVPAAPAQEEAKGDRTRVAGKVTSVSGNTFDLGTRKGAIKVQHDANTEWMGGSEGDLKEGAMVGAAGTIANSVLHASKIGFPKAGRERGARVKRNMIRGEITEDNGHNLTLKTRRGDVGVVWNENTNFHGGTADDLKVGAKIGVRGRPSGEGSAESRAIHAMLIAFKPACEKPAQEQPAA